ncbi:uncharacterized protein BDV17DRAFT_280370 [Aspergillus undulatus]|uniref:uncharacterized protein n=1 Tax=Aspergillus undulatus TaxID=1810928 RepID=UPI003CCE18C9
MRSPYDPILPPQARLRREQACVPKPVASVENELVLRDQRAVHQDMRIEHFAGRPVILDGVLWRVISLEATPDLQATALKLINPRDGPQSMFIVASSDAARAQFPSENGLHTLGVLKHGIVRMTSMTPRTEIRIPRRSGDSFEARLRGRELDGQYMIDVGDGQLVATGIPYNGSGQSIVIDPAEVAPRYERVMSFDFGGSFDVDDFLFREDEVRGQATIAGSRALDPLLGSLPSGTFPLLTNAGPASRCPEVDAHPRKLTVFNFSMSNQGDSRCVLHALLDFRVQNPHAEVWTVASNPGPIEFQDSPEYNKYVMHAKRILIGTHMLFSTGAIMDTRPIDKADFSIELPSVAARAFQRYTDEAIHNEATDDRGTPHQLIVSVSELVDPKMTQTLINCAANGLDVLIQVREVDSTSALLLTDADVEDKSWWEPRPHLNTIMADGDTAYLGTSYLWPTQCHMIHHRWRTACCFRVMLPQACSCNFGQLRAPAYGKDNICPVSVNEALGSWRLQRGLLNTCIFLKYTICLGAWSSLAH